MPNTKPKEAAPEIETTDQTILVFSNSSGMFSTPEECFGIGLWHLLLGLCMVTPIATSFAAARHANVELAGYALALIVGLVLGACFGWTMWATHWIVRSKFISAAPAKQEWYLRALYFIKLVWIVLAGFVGMWLSRMLLRVVF